MAYLSWTFYGCFLAMIDFILASAFTFAAGFATGFNAGLTPVFAYNFYLINFAFKAYLTFCYAIRVILLTGAFAEG